MELASQEQKFSPQDLRALCREIWGKAPDDVSFPGGANRKTVKVQIAGQGYIVSKRTGTSRAALEALALRKLAPTGAAPKLIAHRGEFVVQTCIDGVRLTQRLETATGAERGKLLVRAGKTLIGLQHHGRDSGLLQAAPRIGDRPGWHLQLARSAERLARQTGLPAPEMNAAAIAARLATQPPGGPCPAFVKWDARPGNALCAADDAVIWIDWEHCGVASPEDDLVWLLADEWSPICPAAEASLLAHAAAGHGLSLDEITFRFRAKSILHSTIRLGLIYRRKGDGPWWNPRTAMEFDRVGVSPAHVTRLCRRALHWSRETEGFSGISGLLEALAEGVMAPAATARRSPRASDGAKP